MTRDQFIIELGTHLRSGLRTEDIERLILADADDYAAGEAERIAHSPYPPRKIQKRTDGGRRSRKMPSGPYADPDYPCPECGKPAYPLHGKFFYCPHCRTGAAS
jgi:hypothetical protein